MTNLDQNFLLINKPAGWTSFDVVGFIRNRIRKSGLSVNPDFTSNIKVGHAGTLDPFATGLLIVGVGREATKRLDEFKSLPKTYVAEIKLGETSTTGDPTGTITPPVILSKAKDPLKSALRDSSVPQNDSVNIIETTLKSFTGKQSQIPPMYSAKQVGGQRLYKLARAGKTIDRQPSEIEIYDIKLLDYAWPILKIEVKCSAGTYIRTLAEDIGARLGVGGYCLSLVRTAIGNYLLEDAVNPDDYK